MTIVDMLEQSGVLTLLGMSVVFGFLLILVICVSVAGKLIRILGLDKELEKPSRPVVQGAALTAAISAAVSEYRKTH